jgi:hypothetical protein
MASKKKSLTYQQILQYLVAGGDIGTLTKETNVTQPQLLSVLAKNPELFSQYKEAAGEQAQGLDIFSPESWYSPDEIAQVNEYTEQYNRMEEPVARLAGDYFTSIYEAGNNPIRVAEIEQYYSDPTIAESYGISPDARFLVLEKLKGDAPRWFSRQLEVERGNQEKNYKAFQKQRETLDIQKGESALGASLRQSTGFGELAGAIDPSVTFEEIAGKRAGGLYKTERQKEIEKMPASRVDAFMDIPKLAKDVRASATQESNRKLYEKAFLEMAKKKGGKKATPYTESIKKMLPAIATRLSVEG